MDERHQRVQKAMRLLSTVACIGALVLSVVYFPIGRPRTGLGMILLALFLAAEGVWIDRLLGRRGQLR